MAKQEFKYIKGKCSPGCPADICFYTDVDNWSVDNFIYEFDYLLNYVVPSKIRIHINSVGGSVVDGISVFSKIIDCPIPTECVNDGLAASMGSVIWAAGNELWMKDYALLMIHNPFCGEENNKEYNQVTDAFTKSLKTIYKQRFGLSDDEIETIMNGNEGEDGTFMTAQEAVEKGFVRADHIIATPAAIKAQIEAALKDPQGVTNDIMRVKAVYSLAMQELPSATIEEQRKQPNTQTMENDINVFAALFGLTGAKATAENVTAQINELKAQAEQYKASAKLLEDTKAELTQVKAELTGAKTSISNLTKDLDEAKAALKVYEEAEAKAKEEKVNALIDQAISDCKIPKEDREIYASIARNNFEHAVKILANITGREKIAGKIAEGNKPEAAAGVQSEEEKINAKVNEVIGENFQFRKLD